MYFVCMCVTNQSFVFAPIFFPRVNCYEIVNPQAPFGGFKMSGLGRELYVIFIYFFETVSEVTYTCRAGLSIAILILG